MLPRKSKNFGWSSYFTEASNASTFSDSNELYGLLSDTTEEKVSFVPKKVRDLVKLVEDQYKGPSSNSSSGSREEGERDTNVNWVAISKKLSSENKVFSARDCYIQYNNVESKQINKEIWTAEDDKKLLSLAQMYEVMKIETII